MSVHFDDSGTLSVCAYSGCWEGIGDVSEDKVFLVLVGHDLKFSTSRNGDDSEDLLIAIDRSDAVATLKVGAFAHPLLCEPIESGE